VDDLLHVRAGNLSDIPQLSQAYAESWKTTYEGMVPDPFVKGMTAQAAAKIFFDSLRPNDFSYFLHVAETPEGRIVGFADGGKERSHPEKGVGELYAIYLLKEFQGKGIGRRLWDAAARSLVESDLPSMVTWVLERSPSRKFYESIGGKLEPGTKRLEVAGHPIQLVSYGWKLSTEKDKT